MQKNEFQVSTNICKVDDSLGLVFGWAIVCKQNGEPYFDTQGDHIPEDAMLDAATDFMMNSRMAKDMHGGEDSVLPGSVVFAFPMTTEVAKAFGFPEEQTGLLIAMKPESDEILNKFRTGEYTGFSIGGRRITDEEVDDAV
jgi:hypothetical protein